MAPVVALEPLRNSVLVLAGVVILLAHFLLLQRTWAAISTARRNRREPALSRLVYGVVQTSPVDASAFRRLSRFDRRLVRSILLGLALDLRGDIGETIAELYRALGFVRKDLKRLRSWRAAVRAAAAADLGLIHLPDSIPMLVHALNDRDVRVRQAAVWAVGQVGTASALTGLVRLLGDPSLVVSHRVQEVLAERGREVANAILSYATGSSSRRGRLAAIELIGWLRITTASDLLLVCMGDLDPEIRVKSVKAAAAIGNPRFLEPFHALLEDHRWEVRCQAAKGLSVFGSPSSVPRLTAALRDRQWWVRFYAATALAEVGESGEEALSMALRDEDPSVQDMARYLLERGGAVPALP
ncbi:MAG TPA: HEAT repeat domain-containing protein [Gemmatimonadales bacterium]